MSWYSFHTGKLNFQSYKDSPKSTSGYVYTLSGFFVVSIATMKAFWLIGPLAILSKILLCANGGTMAWSK